MKTNQYNIQLKWSSHRKSDPIGFRKIEKKGKNNTLFLHFLTPARLVIEDEEIYVTRHACIIYTPGIRQEYGAISDISPYENDFITITADTEKLFSTFQLPLNKPFYVNNPHEITKKVEWITWAAANHEEELDETGIYQGIIDLFTYLKKNLARDDPKNQRDEQTKQRFILVRGKAMIDPKGWTVEKMAKACYLTRSRFSVVYKEFFGTSPGQDLLTAMMSYAKERIQYSNDLISHIAIDCGYSKPESFIRMFTKIQGITPSQFRKNTQTE